MTASLSTYRKAIDRIDDRLFTLIKKRIMFVCKIWRYKKKKGLPKYDRVREKQMVRVAAEKTGLPTSQVQKLYQVLFALQNRIKK